MHFNIAVYIMGLQLYTWAFEAHGKQSFSSWPNAEISLFLLLRYL